MKTILLGNGLTTQVSNKDFVWLNKWKWTATNGRKGTYYAGRFETKNGKQILIMMHCEIYNRFNEQVPIGKCIDFVDRDTLNNQRHNFRIADKCQNRWNINKQKTKNKKPLTSKYLGVHKIKKRWGMQITIRGKRYFKTFDTELESAKEYDRMVKLHRGEFGIMNFPHKMVDKP